MHSQPGGLPIVDSEEKQKGPRTAFHGVRPILLCRWQTATLGLYLDPDL